MTARKRSIKSDLTKVDAHRITKAEYDEAPKLTKAMLDRAEIHTSEFEPGTVVAQSPPPNSRSPGISLLINRGDAGTSYVMPDLIGTLGARSEAVLRRLGFRISINGDVPYPGLPSGIVVRQTPQAGFQIASGETISLEVSR